MKIKFFSFLFIIVLPALVLASFPFKISIQVYGNQHLVGTPVMAKVTTWNATGQALKIKGLHEGRWYLDGKHCARFYRPDRVPLPPWEQAVQPQGWDVSSDWKIEDVLDLAVHCDIKTAGNYILEYRYIKEDGTYWADPAQVEIQIRNPIGEDKAAYDSYQACLKLAERKKGNAWQQCIDQLLSEHPSSIYAGWLLKNWRSDLPGVFVKNETAILAAVTRNKEDMDRYWRLDVSLPESQKIRDRKLVMKNLIDTSESFVNAHPDFSFSGWLLARAGFNALGLGDFRTACVDLKRSLQLGWDLPEARKVEIEPFKEGTTYALELLKQHGYCKKD